MVGNGNLALTADITGLATFPEQYSRLAPLSIAAQWAWHSFPNPSGHRFEDSLVPIEVRGTTRYFPWFRDWAEAKRPHLAWLRQNPHRFSLGRLALHLQSAQGKAATFADLSHTSQRLELWTGRLLSDFVFDGARVSVETSVLPERDVIVVRVRSALLADGRLGVDLKFPGVAVELNPDPAEWNAPAAHQTRATARSERGIRFERRLDDTRYHVRAEADVAVEIRELGPHAYRFMPRGKDVLTLLVEFSEQPAKRELPKPEQARNAVSRHWQSYWTEGGAVDFSGSADVRAFELERRVVLSQYLMAVNAAGRLPPQEEGLFSNSWNGKFHLEMHLWHAAHFATWGRSELLERSMPWYLEHLPRARQRARAQGVRGAWWPKMVGPQGRESPSVINPLIMWQQPHPIYLAELIYRSRPTRATLERYRELVFESAELLASYPHFDARRDRYVLGPPIVPAQEVFPGLTTYNPSFELAYFRFGLDLAQRWRERLGLVREPEWDRVLSKLSPLPEREGLYLATESDLDTWVRARTKACAPGRAGARCTNRDHPSFVAALGLLPGAGVKPITMRRTLAAVSEYWDLRHTWGWDFPMLAMTAARLHQPAKAVDFLLVAAKNFSFGRAGMTPRVHVDESLSSASVDGPGYRRAAETYFPSNGALLLAVGMMAAGWDGESRPHPGFPSDGSWNLRSEGLRPLP